MSRQTISKWESDSSYPEMEKILTLCEMFGCTMDLLLRGNVEEVNEEDKDLYDTHMQTFNLKIACSISAIIAGVGLTSIVEGLGFGDPVQAITFFSILIVATVVLVVTGIQDGEFRKRYPAVHVTYTQEELDEAIRRFPVRMGMGVGLILMGILWGGATDGFQAAEDITGGIFLFFVAAGVWFLVYGGLQREKMDVEKYNRTNRPDTEEKLRSEKIGKWCGCIMILAAMIYLLAGFLKDAWNIAWVAFLVGGLLCGIVAIVFGKSDNR